MTIHHDFVDIKDQFEENKPFADIRIIVANYKRPRGLLSVQVCAY